MRYERLRILKIRSLRPEAGSENLPEVITPVKQERSQQSTSVHFDDETTTPSQRIFRELPNLTHDLQLEEGGNYLR